MIVSCFAKVHVSVVATVPFGVLKAGVENDTSQNTERNDGFQGRE